MADAENDSTFFEVSDYTMHGAADAGEGRWHVEDYGIPELRQKTGRDGEGVTVVVVDTGVDKSHPDLADVVSADCTGEGGLDTDGHGSHCCGIVRSVAPAARVVSVRVFGRDGRATYGNIIRCLREILAGKHGQVGVVNMSLGAGEAGEEMRLLLLELAARGVTLVCAAGNSSDHEQADAPRFGTIDWPAHFNSTLAVGSLDRRKKRSSYSSTGPKISVMAPGERIVSSWKEGKDACLSGTSMAAPFVAGVLALAKQGGDVNLSRLLWALAKSSERMEKPGFDNFTGYGRIRPRQLIDALSS